MRAVLLCSLVVLAVAAGGWSATGAWRADAACVAEPNAGCLVEAAVRAGHRAPLKDQSSVARALAAVGRFDAAASAVNRIADERERNLDADELLAHRVVWQAGLKPDRVADLDTLDALAARLGVAAYSDGPRRRAYAYSTVAIRLCRTPYYASGEAPPLWRAQGRQRSSSSSDATLREMLRRWPDVIGAVASDNAAPHRISYAKALACAGRRSEAAALLRRLESETFGTDKLDPAIFYAWLNSDFPAEAEALALRAPRRLSAIFLSRVVQRALDEGRDGRAAELAEALVAAALDGTGEPGSTGQRFEAIRLAVAAFRATGASERAARAAADAVALARSPEPGLGGFAPFALARVAAIHNDLGRAAEARAAIREAMDARPGDGTVIGFGVVSGTVTYRDWGLGDRLKMMLLIELWRAGETGAAFAWLKELQSADPYYRYHAWTGIYRAAAEAGRSDISPGDLPVEVPAALWPGLAADLAAFHLDRGERGAAEAWASSAVRQRLGTAELARAAALLSRADLVRAALEQAPGHIGAEPLRRVLVFTKIAAAFHELLGQPQPPAGL